MRRLRAAVAVGRGRVAVYAHTAHSLRLVERAAMCVRGIEPLLLVGETGTGKTALIQVRRRPL